MTSAARRSFQSPWQALQMLVGMMPGHVYFLIGPHRQSRLLHLRDFHSFLQPRHPDITFPAPTVPSSPSTTHLQTPMMAGFMSYFGAGRKDPKQAARDAIVGLRQQLQMIEKKEEYLQKKIEEEMKKARANAVSNKAAATAALKRKKVTEQELDRLAGSRLQLEMQVNTLESANLNAETMAAMKKASDALKVIHGNLTIDKVDATMNAMNEQRELANEIAESLANPINAGIDIDEDELANELDELQQDELNSRLNEADHVPVHLPPGSVRAPVTETRTAIAEDDEEEQLKKLQAELAM